MGRGPPPSTHCFDPRLRGPHAAIASATCPVPGRPSLSCTVEPAAGSEWCALRFREELRYWRGQLDGVSMLELPTDRSRPHVTTSRIAAQAFDVPRETSSRLAAVVGQHDVSWLELTVAALQVGLARHTAQDDLVV